MNDANLTQLVYRSTAAERMDGAALNDLLVHARARNQAESLTGMLVHHAGCFVQWLEGPADSLERVWRSIQRDPRHTGVERLHTPWHAKRLFPDWRMQLGTVGAVAQEPQTFAVPGGAVEALSVGHPLREEAAEFMAGIAFWRTLPPPEALAAALMDRDDAPVQALVAQVLAAKPSVHALGWHLLGPATRELGRAWTADDCDSTDLLLAQGRLQTLMHRVLDDAPQGAPRSGGAALVAVPPGEDHLAGLTFAGIALSTAGWTVHCAFPRSDAELGVELRGGDFDVLHLASSDSFGREHQLGALIATIRSARRASRNPLLRVLVSGRAFAQQPGLANLVGADGEGIGQGGRPADVDALLDYARRCLSEPALHAAQQVMDSVADRVRQVRFGVPRDAEPGGTPS